MCLNYLQVVYLITYLFTCYFTLTDYRQKGDKKEISFGLFRHYYCKTFSFILKEPFIDHPLNLRHRTLRRSDRNLLAHFDVTTREGEKGWDRRGGDTMDVATFIVGRKGITVKTNLSF